MTVRAVGTPHPSTRWDMFMHGDGSPPQLVWAFYYLLERFVRSGPLLPEYNDAIRYRNMSIKNVIINCVSPEDPTTMTTLSKFRDWIRENEDEYPSYPLTPPEIPSIMRPEWLAHFLYSGVQTLRGPRPDGYQELFYKHVGNIHFCVDGKLLWGCPLGSERRCERGN
ncbi:hypothetical protein ASPWEDRAFT_41380 [Aspergillus wentii DTO 134E9]|uniref:Uncharacterized protein n=1 Tax=Aspergillus wentii DTO 134E9 TaxID=1073089 RepID=A0A1L9RMG8_ASPWE|nr:uncharacterized protein ASPWEDRAFT_41380 [Aspergillus wentii DTO 134E9]OJJ36150.1 hypothetical protein ASPWEDRAFT_41380 [Aspergillus wentii DTO 134E9]